MNIRVLLLSVLMSCWWSSSCELCFKDDNDQWEIDAEWGGNEMRFANYPNHDEIANMTIDYRLKNKQPIIMFKASRDIKAGDELLWDYDDESYRK